MPEEIPPAAANALADASTVVSRSAIAANISGNACNVLTDKSDKAIDRSASIIQDMLGERARLAVPNVLEASMGQGRNKFAYYEVRSAIFRSYGLINRTPLMATRDHRQIPSLENPTAEKINNSGKFLESYTEVLQNLADTAKNQDEMLMKMSLSRQITSATIMADNPLIALGVNRNFDSSVLQIGPSVLPMLICLHGLYHFIKGTSNSGKSSAIKNLLREIGASGIKIP